jgi:hypothetical protein
MKMNSRKLRFIFMFVSMIGIAIGIIMLTGCEESLNSSQNQAAEGSTGAVGKAPDASASNQQTPLSALSGPVMTVTPQTDGMKAAIGEPAVLKLGAAFPTLLVRSEHDGTLSGSVEREDGSVAATIAARAVKAGAEVKLTPSGKADKPGTYVIRLKLQVPGYHEANDAVYFTVTDPNLKPAADESQIVHMGADGKLAYVPDYRGNRIPDFSHAGYMGGGVKLPDVPVKAVVEPQPGDATQRIQAAIDEVSKLPLDGNGFRGAVLLKKGTYEISGTLRINASGVVLRGEGRSEDGTVLKATGKTERALIEVKGSSAAKLQLATRRAITDLYVPVGARSFRVESAEGFKPGDTVIVRREGNAAFIEEIGMNRIKLRPDDPKSTQQWQPFALEFDRVITNIEGNVVTVDAPITNAIESRWGGGSIIKYTDTGRIQQVGIENMRAVSDFDKSVTKVQSGKTYYADEKHANGFIALDNVKNAWVRDITALHFSIYTVHVQRGAKWVTVQDADTFEMVSVLDGGRRYPYYLTGQLTLFQRVNAQSARHAYIVDSRVPGPNVFLFGEATENYATSEPHHRWSTGGLFDNIRAPIAIQDRQYYGTGHGWSGANYVAWNTEGSLVVQKPPTAQNWSIGHVGEKGKEAFTPRQQGFWESLGRHVEPRSLYLQQLADRLGKQAVQNIGYEDAVNLE